MTTGTLYLIPVPLADNAAAKSFTPYLTDTINQINEYIVENSKTARRFLKEAGLQTPQSELIVHDYGKHNRDNLSEFFTGLLNGKNVGLMSEAGCPSSILLALMASGFNGQSFTFHGYLPIDKVQRSQKIKELENLSETNNQTQIFIETPFRNNPMLEEILRSCKPQTKLCIACNLTAEDEMVQTKSIAEWNKHVPDLHKKPAIFLLMK